jgi:hypothetical protein
LGAALSGSVFLQQSERKRDVSTPSIRHALALYQQAYEQDQLAEAFPR